MNVQKQTIRTDIPGHHLLLTGAKAKSSTFEAEQSRLVVGRSITLRGEMTNCDHLVIEGAVEVQGLSTSQLDILDGGVFYGSAVTQDAVIAGRFEGNLTVHGRLTLKSTAVIVGQISYGAMNMESGAAIDAHIAMLPQVHLEASNDTAPLAQENAPEGEDDQEDETKTTEDRASLFKRVVGY